MWTWIEALRISIPSANTNGPASLRTTAPWETDAIQTGYEALIQELRAQIELLQTEISNRQVGDRIVLQREI